MTGLDVIYVLASLMAIMLVYLFAAAATGRDDWPAVVWGGLKSALIRIVDLLYRVTLGWMEERPAVLEPDWADAADEVGFFDPIDHLLLNVSAWTPEEREVFGVNETDILIKAIDRELKNIEWERTKATLSLPAASIHSELIANDRAIRRNGQQIASILTKAEEVWVGSGMTGGSR